MRAIFTSIPLCLLLISMGCKERNASGTLAAVASSGSGPVTVEPENIDASGKAVIDKFSDGGEMFPYFLVRALQVKGADGTTRKFLDPENLKKYGLLPSAVTGPQNPDNLPVGVTLQVAPDTGFISLGVNCGVCHVAEIHFNDAKGGAHSQRIYGAPNMSDVSAFLGDIIKGFQAELSPSGFNKDFVARATTEANYVKDNLWYIGNKGQSATQRLSQPVKLAFSIMEYALTTALGSKKTPEQMVSELSMTDTQKRLLIARMKFLNAVGEVSKGTEYYGFGRVDAFGVAKNLVFFNRMPLQKPTAPVSFPNLYYLRTKGWYHYNSNTNSVVERNVAQVVSLGGVTDFYLRQDPTGKVLPPSYITTINLANVYHIEKAFQKATPPVWPASLPLDAPKVARGREVYQKECQTCHEPFKGKDGLYYQNKDRGYTFEEMGTDRNAALQFAAPINGKPVAILLGDLTAAIKDRYYQDNNMANNPALMADWEDRRDAKVNPTGLRDAKEWRMLQNEKGTGTDYVSLPLDGVWASAPFLHNGSVPTLWDLLQPVAKRPKTFWFGHRDYDMDNVGLRYIAEQEGPQPSVNATSLFDAALPGNGNGGHEFGVNLPDTDKRALIEFLKGMGAQRTEPLILSKH